MFATSLLTTLLLTSPGEIRPLVPDTSESSARKGSQTSSPVTESFTGSDSHLKAPQRMRITDAANWRSIWFEHNNIVKLRGRNPHPLPEIDFSRFMVIGLVEYAELFPNGIEIAHVSFQEHDTRKRKGISVVTIDYRSPGKTERFESGAERNVFGFFVIPRYQPQLVLRYNTQNGWKEVEHFPALPPGSGVTITVGPDTHPEISGTVVATPGKAGPNRPRDVSHAGQSRAGSLNIGFAYDPGQGQYDGVVGSPGDVWNFVDIGTTAIDYMRHPNASGSTARLRITRHDGEWAVRTDNRIFCGYIYHNCQCVDLEATLLDVAPGSYRAYVYAHGDAPNQNANIEVIVGDRSLGRKPTSKEDEWEFQSSRLTEGVHYVTFELDVAVGNEIRIISHRDGSNYSMLNAIQLVPIVPPARVQEAAPTIPGQASSPDPEKATGLSVKIDYFTEATTGLAVEPGDRAFAVVTIANNGGKPVQMPELWCSMQAIVDGKAHNMLDEYTHAWNGAGELLPDGRFRSVITLAEFGINRNLLKTGRHTFQVRIGNTTSNTLALISGQQGRQ